MQNGATLVLDVGKTNAKLTLWSAEGDLLATRMRANTPPERLHAAALDVAGVDAWLLHALTELNAKAPIARIVPVAHGAAAALLKDGALLEPPVCYEQPLPAQAEAQYQELRDPYVTTGSPRLPLGLNLGAQLFAGECANPAPSGARIVPYPQYWAWRLSGVAATEITSLGCHTDMWRPFEQRYSDLAHARGWSERFAPLRQAGDVLGVITPEIAARTGLSKTCEVLCGLHDSNSAFYGARAHPELAGRDVTEISTGTWFVAMRAPGANSFSLKPELERRDVLINVDVEGRPAPSARFMGGREVETLIGGEDSPLRSRDFVRDVAPAFIDDVLAANSFILPSFAAGVGPFPNQTGRWSGQPLEGGARRAVVGLYLGLLAHESLSLIGSRDAILIEGRFADDLSFAGMLASLRPDCDVYVARSEDGLAFGALRLANPGLKPRGVLTQIAPLPQDVSSYAAQWREQVEAFAS